MSRSRKGMNVSDLEAAGFTVAEDLLDRQTRPDNLSCVSGSPVAAKGRVAQLNCSDGGVPKLPVTEALLTAAGLVGDRQEHTAFHGGPERALSLFSLELIERLRAEGHPIYPGSTGENVTISGLDWSQLAPGVCLALGGEVVVEITGYATPCKSIRESFAGGEFKRISQQVRPGDSRLYARVLRTGRIAVGQEIRVLRQADGG